MTKTHTRILAGLVGLGLLAGAPTAQASWTATVADVMNLVYCVVGLAPCEGLEPAGSAGVPTCDWLNQTWNGTACISATCEPTVPVTPVYVTVAGHIEDDVGYAAADGDCSYYLGKRANLLLFAEVIGATDVHFNLQVSYEWFQGVAACEDADVTADTDGLNIIDYLVQAFGFEIDVHQEGAEIEASDSGNNFADIRYIGGQVTDHMTETTGFQWDNPDQYLSLQAGQQGVLHPEFTWQPQVLAGGASVVHHDGDFTQDMTSIGVWIPSDFSPEAFHTHDTSEDARMVYVGSGPNQWCSDWNSDPACHFHNTAEFVGVVADYLATGQLAPGQLYTTTFFIPQAIMFQPVEHAKASAVLDQLTSLADAGAVKFAHFTEVVADWHAIYGSVPNIVTYEQIDPVDYTCAGLPPLP